MADTTTNRSGILARFLRAALLELTRSREMSAADAIAARAHVVEVIEGVAEELEAVANGRDLSGTGRTEK